MAKPASFFAFGNTALIMYLAFLSAFVPLSIDLYLPALPTMAQYFNAPPELTNLTLSSFTLIFALSMLVWGPLSDKFGRKTILMAGLVIYIFASIGAAMSESIYQLIAGRCLQALGSGAVSAVSMAIVKDTFEGRTMETVLTWIQTMTVLAPMLAPVLGGFMLAITSWRGLFWVLTACGVLAMAGGFALRETLTTPTTGSVFHCLGRIGVVLKNRNYRSLLLVFSVASMPLMAYLATSSYIYEEIFHVTAQHYSYFFAANAAFSMLGPLLYVRFLRELPRRGFIAANFFIIAFAAGLLLIFGHRGPFAFALLFLPISFCGSALRPPSTVLMMSQIDTDNGTVASLIGSVGLLFGSLAMLLCSLPWKNFIAATGAISLMVGLLCGCAWLWLDRNRTFTTKN